MQERQNSSQYSPLWMTNEQTKLGKGGRHEADVTVSERDDLFVWQPGEVRAGDHHATGIYAIQPSKDMKERALSNARCTNDCYHLPRLDAEIEIAEYRQRRASDVITLSDTRGFQ